MTNVHQWNKVNCSASFLASSITSFSVLTLVSCQAEIFEFFPSFVHCCFCFRNLHCFRQRNQSVQKIVVVQRADSFSCNVVFMIYVSRPFQPSSRRFVGFNNAREFGVTMSVELQVTLCWLLLILQGIAASIGISKFLRAFFQGCFHFFVL